jgi:hypothetical protein
MASRHSAGFVDGTQGCSLGFHSGSPLGLRALRDAAEGFGLGGAPRDGGSKFGRGGVDGSPGLAPGLLTFAPLGLRALVCSLGGWWVQTPRRHADCSHESTGEPVALTGRDVGSSPSTA